MKRLEIDTDTTIVRLIRNAKCNGGVYHEPPQYREWPRKPGTWLQKRLAEIKEREVAEG